MAEVSSTRLYLGNLPRDVTKEDIQNHFKEANGTIAEVKLMNGFGFIEYEDAMDARDVVPAYHGSDLNGSRLTVQFARGSRQRPDFPGPPERPHPRPRRTAHRMQITGLPGETSWQDLKDFARRSGLDVVYSEVGRDRDGKGLRTKSRVMNVTIVLDLHRLAVVLTLRMATTIIVPLHLATTRLVPAMMDIVAAARLVTMMNTLVMITAIDPHLPCVLAAGRPLKIPTHLLVEAMIAICTRLHLQDVPTMTPTPRMDMVVPGRGARLQGAMADTKGVHVT
ncbi:MAG: hypothetical protein L6R39_004315, partial [Caloplaca ligustica]